MRGEVLKFSIPISLVALVCLSACDFDPDRSLAFQKKVQEGTPIVRAIEKFRKDTGAYPASFTDLTPKYLPASPSDIIAKPQYYYRDWEYYTITNGTTVSYHLYYFMGKGGVDYTPPVWRGDNDGHKRVIGNGP
jgi:hypothetical protein